MTKDFKRILVCGGRDYFDPKKVFSVLDEYSNSIEYLCQGEAKGADTLAKVWAYLNLPDKNVYCYPAAWDQYGKKAGSIRNQFMLDDFQPDLIIAFPGNYGTRDMISRGQKAGVEVRIIS